MSASLADAGDVDPRTAVVTDACGGAPPAAALLTLLNAWRAQGADCDAAGTFAPAAPLNWEDRLARTAQRQARAMARQHRLSHEIDGADLGARLHAGRYDASRAAENLSAGPTTWEAVAGHWMASAPHCANVMAPWLREAGVGCATDDDVAGAPIRYWALVLGAPRTPERPRQMLSASR